MIRLVPIRAPRTEPISRMWLVFFGEGTEPAWWARFFAPGYRHVRAAAYFGEAGRWVLFDPTRRGTVVEVLTESEFEPWLARWLGSSVLVLRVTSRFDRGSTPATWHCVGAIKALLGVRSRALSPRGLAAYLLAHGAEVVAPVEPALVQPVQHAEPASGGPISGRAAQAGAGTG